MGRIRSFFRRIAKPAAMTATVGAVSLSLIVTTPSNAQAFKARDLKAAETFVMGATKTIAPVATVGLAVASVTPVGMVLRVAQLGLLAYETKDLWWPFVAGTFGQGGSNENTPATTSTVGLDPYFSMKTVFEKSGTSAMIVEGDARSAPSNTPATYVQISAHLQCRQNADGSGANYDVKRTATTSYTGGGWNQPRFTLSCGQGILTGLVVGAPGADPLLTASEPSAGKGPKNVVRWGNVQSTSGGFDPYGSDVKYKVRSECIAPDGTISTVEAESSGDYMKMPSCAAAGKGHGTGKTSITGLAPGTTVEQPLWDSPRAPSDPATPLCDATRATDGCTISVELDGKPCTTDNVECQNWAEIQKNDPNNTRLKCKFGPYYVPMAQCAVLEGAYLLGGSPATKENTDGDPATKNWSDPSGGQLAPKTPTQTGVNTMTTPGSQGQPAPGPAGSPESKMANCFPSGWAVFNPLEWVLKPVRCAFEPSQTPTQIQARANATMTLAQGKAPISFLNLELVGPSGGGCPNWTMNVPGMFSQNVVCGSSFTDALLSVRGPLFGLLATAMVWPLIRSLWYAAIPVLRVAPSSGGK